VENASGQVGENAISKSQEVMAQVSSALANDLDAAPRITPVLDMSQVEAGSARLNGLFGTRNIRVNAGIADGAASYTESRAGSFGYTGYDDRNVVEAVAAMNDRIAQLSEDIANLQIVLDTGILAGALTPKIDRKLGDLAALKGRSAFY
jgi:ABC-type transporter Mla subunit MlaD